MVLEDNEKFQALRTSHFAPTLEQIRLLAIELGYTRNVEAFWEFFDYVQKAWKENKLHDPLD